MMSTLSTAVAMAATPEEITLAVKEFIIQFAPQFLATFEKYSIIFTGVVTGVILLVTIFVNIVKLKQSKNKLKAAMTPYEHNKELIDTIKTDILDRLTGTFDVDITNKLNPILDSLVTNTNTDIATINEKLNVMTEALLAITKVFANSGSLTQEEFSELLKAISDLPDTCAQKQTPTHVQVSIGEATQDKLKKPKIMV